MIGLTDNELKTLMRTAEGLPIDKRSVFLERVGATLNLRRVSIDEAIDLALCGLMHGPQAA
jgi:hypothetical protein